MDVLLPEDPQEVNNTSTARAMEGETTTSTGDSLNHGTSQEGHQNEVKEGDNGGNGNGEVGAGLKQSEGGESGEAAATVSAQAGKEKHASGRKPRTKGLIKKLQEQVSIKQFLNIRQENFEMLCCDCFNTCTNDDCFFFVDRLLFW